MSSFPGSPRLVKGGLVLMDPDTSAVIRVIVLQYNPDTLTRTLQVQGVGGQGDRSEALRLKGPAVETIKVDAEIDATDQLEQSDQNPNTAQFGILPQLAALETIVYPSVAQIQSNQSLAQAGTLEIIPMETPLVLFVWTRNRVLPVRITDFSITEEAFDPALNPIRAKVSLGLRVLSIDDLPSDHKGTGLFMAYLQQKESLRSKSPAGSLSGLGIEQIP
jgi:hypothetical protein